MLHRQGFVDSERGWSYVLSLETFFGKRDEYYFGIPNSPIIPKNLQKKAIALYGSENFNAIAFRRYDYTGFFARRESYQIADKMVIVNFCNEDMFGFGTSMIYEGDNYNIRNGEVIAINSYILYSASSSFPFWLFCIYQIV
jgi:hypothetical protein